MTVVYVALGGAAGAVLRYLCTLAVAWPWATFAVNVVGSFLMGLAFVWLASRPGWQPLAMAGLLGGFTTFSAFSLDALRLIEGGQLGTAMLYVGGTVALCLAAVFAGAVIARGLA